MTEHRHHYLLPSPAGQEYVMGKCDCGVSKMFKAAWIERGFALRQPKKETIAVWE